MNIKEIVTTIKASNPNINHIYYVGCGASQADLYPSKYFLSKNAKKLRTELYTANDFNYSAPITLGPDSIVITCSLGGNTPETVAAAKKARAAGAPVICLSNKADSPLAENADYPIIHGFFESYSAKMQKLTKCLELAAEILNQFEGYEHYEDMLEGCKKIYSCIDDSIPYVMPLAEKFGKEYCNDKVIYVTSSGPTTQVAYCFSAFIFMEMQWIDSASFSTGEFFHGPFELAEEGKPYLLLINDGPTREMDLRCLSFLERMNAKVTVVDAKDYNLSGYVPASVKEYFNPILIDGLLRPFGEAIASERKHPLTMRRYMWKLSY